MNVIPVVVGALGAVAKLEEYLGMIEIQQKKVDRIQFSALHTWDGDYTEKSVGCLRLGVLMGH